MDYLLITDFQKCFVYHEFTLKLHNFFNHSAVRFLFKFIRHTMLLSIKEQFSCFSILKSNFVVF